MNVPLFCNCPSKKEKEKKWKEGKNEFWPFKSPGSHFSWSREGLATMEGGETIIVKGLFVELN